MEKQYIIIKRKEIHVLTKEDLLKIVCEDLSDFDDDEEKEEYKKENDKIIEMLNKVETDDAFLNYFGNYYSDEYLFGGVVNVKKNDWIVVFHPEMDENSVVVEEHELEQYIKNNMIQNPTDKPLDWTGKTKYECSYKYYISEFILEGREQGDRILTEILDEALDQDYVHNINFIKFCP